VVVRAAAVVPDLASHAPLWLALLTVGVNAMVGALRGYDDDSRPWDVVGVSTFALLMGLGGGFIRDMLLGNLPAESLRSPWYLSVVLVAIAVVLLVGRHLRRGEVVMDVLNALALGLFAVTGTAYGFAFGLPVVSAVLVGVISAVGGGVLVSVLQNHIPGILVASTPNALLAVVAAGVYAALGWWSPGWGSVAGIGAVLLLALLARRYDLQTRPAGRTPAPAVPAP
jgi:uncharacterized membrane protein YeiH